jgi:site-specific DNA recombinase
MQHKICFYIRVSTEEQAKNLEGSIKNQTDRLYEAVKFKNSCSEFGEVVSIFIDRAKSGKDTKRSELQKMLFEIEQGNINLVMVSEISRISRNMKDFSGIWEMMKKNSCGFYSLRENFDTTTAAGEMVLYTIANIAQFERRQVSERVSANINARSKRGLFNGGSVPVGYKLNPDKKGTLEVDPDMKDTIITCYKQFLEKETLSQTARFLNEAGYTLKRWKQGGGRYKRLSHFTVDNLHKILKNKTYIGIKTFKDGDKIGEVKAAWDGIVDIDLFNRVQDKLKRNYRRKKSHSKTRYPYLLSGITYCLKCGDVMCGKSAHGNGGKIGYYEHSWATKRESTLTKKTFKCSPHRVLAKKLEPLVIEKVEELLFNETFSKHLFEKLKLKNENTGVGSEVNSLKSKLYGISSQVDALVERLSELPKGVSARPIYKQMKSLEERKSLIESNLEQMLVEDNKTDYTVNLDEYSKFIKSFRKSFFVASPEVKSKIIQRLVHKIEVGDKSVVLHYNVDKRNLGLKNTKAPDVKSEAFCSSNNFYRVGSNSLTTGGACKT